MPCYFYTKLMKVNKIVDAISIIDNQFLIFQFPFMIEFSARKKNKN